MTGAKKANKKYGRFDDQTFKGGPEARVRVKQEVRQEILEQDLKAIRELLGKTQEEVAAALEMSQSQVSQTESRPDPRLSTLRRYVHALGGELEIIANFGDKRIRVHA